MNQSVKNTQDDTKNKYLFFNIGDISFFLQFKSIFADFDFNMSNSYRSKETSPVESTASSSSTSKRSTKDSTPAATGADGETPVNPVRTKCCNSIICDILSLKAKV